MKKFVCPVCGYVYEGESIPEGFKCPVCKVDGSKFKVMEEGKLAAEHEYGIYAKTVKNNPDISDEDKKFIFEQLMANFNGECSEVGMYLCMARVAHREGYPEIGLYWEKAAYEEAEHAAKFAEMLGSDLEPNMKATTKDNLAWECKLDSHIPLGCHLDEVIIIGVPYLDVLCSVLEVASVVHILGESADNLRLTGKTWSPYHLDI